MESRKIKGIVGRCIAGVLAVQSVVPLYAINWDPFYDEMDNAGTPTTDIWSVLADTNQQWSTLEKLLDIFDINYAGQDKALSYIQIIANYVLSFAAFIALIVIIYGFYMMFFRDQDKWVGEAKKTVIGAAIALGVIGISWLFVNFAFYLFYQWI